MNFLALLPIFSTLIDRVFPDKEKQDAAKLELMKAANDAAARQAQADAARDQASAQVIESKSKVVIAEAQSESAAARNWRPHLMYSIMIIIMYNYVIAPILQSAGLQLLITPIPQEMWTLLSISVGGYIVGKSGEKIADSFNDKKFFEAYKSRLKSGNLTQADVDVLNEALQAGKKG